MRRSTKQYLVRVCDLLADFFFTHVLSHILLAKKIDIEFYIEGFACMNIAILDLA